MEFMKKVEEISKIVGKTATDTYNTVADKSGKLFEEAKTKFYVSDKTTELEGIYEAMGKTVYDCYKNGDDVGKAFTKEAKKVDKILSDIDNANKKILLNKKLRLCLECNEIISLESEFCQVCGKKQKPVKIKEEKVKESEEIKEEPISKVCAQCGLVCEAKAKFCPKCGLEIKK